MLLQSEVLQLEAQRLLAPPRLLLSPLLPSHPVPPLLEQTLIFLPNQTLQLPLPLPLLGLGRPLGGGPLRVRWRRPSGAAVEGVAVAAAANVAVVDAAADVAVIAATVFVTVF